MAENGWKQYLETGMQFGELSRAQAQKVVTQLVREGQVAEGRARNYVDELIDRSRKRTEDVRQLVQREIKEQLSALGFATKDDLKKLEQKLVKATAASAASARRTAAKSTTAAKKPGKTAAKTRKTAG